MLLRVVAGGEWNEADIATRRRGSGAALSPQPASGRMLSLYSHSASRGGVAGGQKPAKGRHKEAVMGNDETVDRRPFKPWAEWRRKQFKEEIEEAWQAKRATSDSTR